MTDRSLHDPGGRRITKLPPAMFGDAAFSGNRGEYRRWLYRSWGGADRDRTSEPYALWIGLNPSTARGDVNDPTITRELGFTKALLRMNAYYKVNLLDFRATKPSTLLVPGVVPRSASNLSTLRELAAQAAVLVVAFGTPHSTLVHYAHETINLLKLDGRQLWCLGRTVGGFPRHPLYLRSDTQLEVF